MHQIPPPFSRGGNRITREGCVRLLPKDHLVFVVDMCRTPCNLGGEICSQARIQSHGLRLIGQFGHKLSRSGEIPMIRIALDADAILNDGSMVDQIRTQYERWKS